MASKLKPSAGRSLREEHAAPDRAVTVGKEEGVRQREPWSPAAAGTMWCRLGGKQPSPAGLMPPSRDAPMGRRVGGRLPWVPGSRGCPRTNLGVLSTPTPKFLGPSTAFADEDKGCFGPHPGSPCSPPPLPPGAPAVRRPLSPTAP